MNYGIYTKSKDADGLWILEYSFGETNRGLIRNINNWLEEREKNIVNLSYCFDIIYIETKYKLARLLNGCGYGLDYLTISWEQMKHKIKLEYHGNKLEDNEERIYTYA